MRVVVDPGVIVSAALSERGAPAQLLLAWDAGELELVVSPLLLAELRRVLHRPAIAERIERARANGIVTALHEGGVEVSDPEDRPRATRDPEDDYLVALAREAGADVIVSGDRDLLEADVRPPVLTPRELLDLLRGS